MEIRGNFIRTGASCFVNIVHSESEHLSERARDDLFLRNPIANIWNQDARLNRSSKAL